jgi:hypothetical protein
MAATATGSGPVKRLSVWPERTMRLSVFREPECQLPHSHLRLVLIGQTSVVLVDLPVMYAYVKLRDTQGERRGGP